MNFRKPQKLLRVLFLLQCISALLLCFISVMVYKWKFDEHLHLLQKERDELQIMFIKEKWNGFLHEVSNEVGVLTQFLQLYKTLPSLETFPLMNRNSSRHLYQKIQIRADIDTLFNGEEYFDSSDSSLVFLKEIQLKEPSVLEVRYDLSAFIRKMNYKSRSYALQMDTAVFNQKSSYSALLLVGFNPMSKNEESLNAVFFANLEIAAVLIGVVLLFLLLHFILAQKLFVTPIQKLYNKTLLFKDGGQVSIINEPSHIEEWESLSTMFDQMVIKIKEREMDLEMNRKALKSTLEKIQDQQLQIIHTEKMASIGSLSAGIAHEINNPITFVQNNLYSLELYQRDISEVLKMAMDVPLIQSKCDVEDIKEILDDLPSLFEDTKKGLQKVTRIVHGLKQFSHSAGEIPVRTNLVDIVENAIQMTWYEFKYKAELIKKYDKEIYAEVFPDQIGQVIVNLLVNSCQAIRKFGNIWVDVSEKGGEAIIVVKDDGEGMDEMTRNRLFDPFYTTKPVGQGTGLGLSISMDIAKKHKGRIEVYSEKEKGTEMRLILPKKNIDYSENLFE